MVGSNNFLINKTTPTPVVRVGEEVSFDIFVQNVGPEPVRDNINLKDFFNPDEFEYVDWHPNAWAGKDPQAAAEVFHPLCNGLADQRLL